MRKGYTLESGEILFLNELNEKFVVCLIAAKLLVFHDHS